MGKFKRNKNNAECVHVNSKFRSTCGGNLKVC